MQKKLAGRQDFIGGSDARVIMGDDQPALLHLWREKRGETEPEDLSNVLTVQLGTVTEDLNRRWYERHASMHRDKRSAAHSPSRLTSKNTLRLTIKSKTGRLIVDTLLSAEARSAA